MTRFVDVSALRRIVNRVGAGRFLSGLAAAMHEDFRRLDSFEKSARLASHSETGPLGNPPTETSADMSGDSSTARSGNPLVEQAACSSIQTRRMGWGRT